MGGGGACCKYSEATLKVFITPVRRSCLENPALDGEVGKYYFCSLTDGSAPGGRRERKASWTFLIVTAIPLHACRARNTKSRCMLAKVKRRTLGCAQAGLTGPRGDGFRGV